MRIGIDVGGTNTDAVLMDERSVLAEVKTPTTPDVTSGIVAALRTLISDSGVEASQVQGVMIGTTHFTNAVVEAKRDQVVGTVNLNAMPGVVDDRDIGVSGRFGELANGAAKIGNAEIALAIYHVEACRSEQGGHRVSVACRIGQLRDLLVF